MISIEFEAAAQEYSRLFPDSPFFETWVPQSHFIGAEFDGNGNISIGREDDGIYGIAIGSSPVIPTEWKNFSLDSRAINLLPETFKEVAQWDCYWAPTINGAATHPSVASDDEIESFLKEHAPDSSVFPGNREILRWIEVRHEGELAAIAALCRWESGRVVISSVATREDLRGQGFGKRLIAECLIAGGELGEKFLSLGVRHENESGHRLYRGAGFTLMHNFTYCERR
jgi:GNAT superfamily N-acetyltransferase